MFKHLLAISGNILPTLPDKLSGQIFKNILFLSGNFLQTFQDKLSVPTSTVFLALVWISERYREVFPKHLLEISSTRCVMTQKSADLIYFPAKACNNLSTTGGSTRQTHNTDQKPFIFLNHELNLYSIVPCNAWLRKGNITRGSGENVCRSIEKEFNRLM
jgi:hypothetical protein